MFMKSYKQVQLVCLLARGLCSVIASIVWAMEMLKIKPIDSSQSFEFNLGYSWYLNLAGGITALGAAIYYYFYNK